MANDLLLGGQPGEARPAAPQEATKTPQDPVTQDHVLGDFSADRRLLMLMAMAGVVGAAGAGTAWVLLRLIDLATNLFYFGRLSTAPAVIAQSIWGPFMPLVPVVGCLIIGLMARYGSEKIRGHGIPEAMEAILVGRSRIQPKVALLKPLSSAISIGSGGPFGAEGPIIMTGGAIGSLFAQFFHLTDAERKTLLVAGAAAGMSATFGTPVAAMLLAVELLLFEWKPRSFIPVAIAAAVAAACRPALLGAGPLFPLADSAALPATGLALCAVLGVLAGLGSGLLTSLVYGFEDLFGRLPLHWMWWPMIGGVFIGLGGLIDPRALGVGYDNIAGLLHGQIPPASALTLVAVKAVIWSVALGSGTSGGVLAPLLMMGGALGALFGAVAPMGEAGEWALVGMAAMMGGTMRAPLTAMIFALELSHDVGALLPLAIACALSHGTTVLLLKRSILTEKVARRGHHIVREYAVDPFETMRVAQVMAQPVDTLPAAMPLTDALAFFTGPEEDGQAPRTRHRSYPVVDADGQVVGMASRTDALRWARDGQWDKEGAAGKGWTLGDQCAHGSVAVAYDDELVGRVADRMGATDHSRLPVLSRDSGRLVGLVAQRDLLAVRHLSLRQEQRREALLSLPLGARRTS
ncbi:chloride channel protein [Nitrospirillum sp. BR 11752]|uniref:chloride channel protein n=1 Tax=Nitrospirillum sp. BR 11752 TaxID=3104293 RepID=UPI002EBC2002|nr:chloride channel protein [Nitrospirillum sp. BR 11752]